MRGGRLREMPRKVALRAAVLEWLAADFDPTRVYSEREVNETLSRRHDDHVMLRRYLVDAGHLKRTDDGREYWRDAIVIAPTAELDAATLASVRELMQRVFASEFDEHDWQHALGGVHALAYVDRVLAGHAALVARELHVAGEPVATGYVEAVAVDPHRRRRGIGNALMDAIERELRQRYALGALAASDEAQRIYAQRGWVRWRGPKLPDGDDVIYVLPLAGGVDAEAELRADERPGSTW